MTGRILTHLRERLAAGEMEPDPAQEAAAECLDDLAARLSDWPSPQPGLMSLLRRNSAAAPRGLYIHGAVGRGKTMLMDLFFECTDFASKRRVHFHEFMAEVHERIARGRATTEGDPIPFVGTEIAGEAGLLCFDELHVTDIADAMVIGRLFRVLIERDVVVVATSNVAPNRLYWHGLNRQLFLPFITLLEATLDVIELKAAKDYRLDKLGGRQLYFSPCDARAQAGLDEHWTRLTRNHPAAPAALEVKGRKVHVPSASMGVARFTFADLCEKPLGPIDYLHIAHAFHTVLIDGIPSLSPARRNEARRLVHLIDTFYDNRVCLIASADAEPHLLYPAGDGVQFFERAASRLAEMRSEAYLAARASRATSVRAGGA